MGKEEWPSLIRKCTENQKGGKINSVNIYIYAVFFKEFDNLWSGYSLGKDELIAQGVWC